MRKDAALIWGILSLPHSHLKKRVIYYAKKKLEKGIASACNDFAGFSFLLVFNYLPIVGIIIAFQKFIPAKGLFGDQDWIGLRNFEYVMNLPNFDNIMWNTFYIAMMKVILGLLVPIVIAILLNEVRHMALKRGVQTAIYLPHFLSWVVLGGIFIEILSPNDGLVNRALQSFGIEPIFSLGTIGGSQTP